MPSNLPAAAKLESDPEHQIVRIMELVEFVADMQENMPCKACFKSDDLVPAGQVVAFVYDIVADTDIDSKNRHRQFGAKRHACGKLFFQRWTVEPELVARVSGHRTCYVVLDIGTFIILHIHGKTGLEELVDAV